MHMKFYFSALVTFAAVHSDLPQVQALSINTEASTSAQSTMLRQVSAISDEFPPNLLQESHSDDSFVQTDTEIPTVGSVID